MLLEGKNAVIYGAGGPIGGAVARALAREGARLHLAGRRLEPLDALAAEIRDHGDAATIATLDALDEQAVDSHAADVVAGAGSIDISLNVISHGEVFGTPLADMTLADYERPIRSATRSTFLTARAGARTVWDSRRHAAVRWHPRVARPGRRRRRHALQTARTRANARRRRQRRRVRGVGPCGSDHRHCDQHHMRRRGRLSSRAFLPVVPMSQSAAATERLVERRWSRGEPGETE